VQDEERKAANSIVGEGATQTMPTADNELQYFVGREDELQELRNFVADPSPGVLLVTGPEGSVPGGELGSTTLRQPQKQR